MIADKLGYLLVCFLGVLPIACSSRESRNIEKIPFHVAVIPITSHANILQDRMDIAFGIDGALLSSALVEKLQEEVFSDVTLLSYPKEFNKKTAEEQEKWLKNEGASTHWIDEAVKSEADLILQCDLGYNPIATGKLNNKFWLSLPLFLTIGPLNYFIDDRTYNIKVSLRGKIHDLSLMKGKEKKLTRDSELEIVEPKLSQVEMNFFDRVNKGSIGTYVLSFFSPAGFLAKKGEIVEASLSEKTIETLASDMAIRIRDKEEDIGKNARVVNFYVEPNSVNLSLNQDGSKVKFSGKIILETGEVQNLRKIEFKANGKTFPVAALKGVDLKDDYENIRKIQYDLNEEIPIAPGVSHINLKVWQDDEEESSRSYTYPVPWPSKNDSV